MDDMAMLLEILSDIKDDVDFASETALVEEGIIDSLDLAKILVALAEAFHVRITAGDVEPENFNSAAAMLALVRQYQGRS